MSELYTAAPDAPMLGTGFQTAPEEQKVIQREMPQPDPARKKLVGQILDKIKKGRRHHAAAFKRMKEDMDFAYKWGIGKQYADQAEDDDRYIANIVQRHVTSRVAALYARNPKVIARPTRRRYFQVWDGSIQALQQAQMAMQNSAVTMMPPPPEVMDLLTDIQQGMMRKKMIENVGETLEILFTYSLKEPVPNFKEQAKQLVRRTETCGVGFFKMGYQRLYAPRDNKASRIADIVDQMQTIDRLRGDFLDKEFDEDAAEYEQLKLALKEIEAEPEVIVREGLVWNFPKSNRIILDTATTNIRGFVGTTWLAEEFDWTVDEVKEMYQVDVTAAAEKHNLMYGEANTDCPPLKGYHFYDRKTGLKYCVIEGWPDFLAEPAAPEVKVEQFFPYYPLIFNAIEHDEEIYPPSDIRLLRSQQREYNRIKESLRQHRIAKRPMYVTPAGALEDDDMESDGHVSLDNYPAHAVIPLNGLAEDQKVSDKIQMVPTVPIDPNVYESEGIFTDVNRITGSQEANLGGTSNSTATESNIAEGSRLSSLESNADDLDSVLTAMARDGGQILLMNMSQESAIEIVGEGAVWPEMTREQVVKEVYLDIEAGSSGRPNKAVDIANFKDMGPLMMQVPGQKPEKLVQYMWKILDDKIDPMDFVEMGLPSITALNGQKQLGTGDPATDPNAQGAEGGQNAPAPPAPGGGSPQIPPPSAMV